MTYYLTVIKDSIDIFRRQPFDDYAEAIRAMTPYYRPRFPGSCATLSLVTEVVNDIFARSYGALVDPERITDPTHDPRYHNAAKQSVTFIYDGSYNFLIESDFGIKNSDDYFSSE